MPERLLLGPGPSNAHPRVLAAMAQPLVGHLDPAFLSLLDEGSALAPGTKQVVWEIVQLLPTDAHTLGRIACLEDGSDNNWGALLQMRAG